MKYTVTALVTVSCYTEVEAGTKEEAMQLAQERSVEDILHDAGYPLEEFWHIDNDGEPSEITIEEEK